jgi:hypothetical protein
VEVVHNQCTAVIKTFSSLTSKYNWEWGQYKSVLYAGIGPTYLLVLEEGS